MSWKDITAGTKQAKAVQIKYVQNKKTLNRAFEVRFEFVEPTTETVEHLDWMGFNTPAARDRTRDILVDIMDYNGDLRTNDDGFFIDQGCINMERTYHIVVDIEEYNGKFSPKIKWVNSSEGKNTSNEPMSPALAKSDLEQSGFSAGVAARIAQKNQVKDVPF